MESLFFWEPVFNFLDAKSLKNVVLVCKTWNDVIGNSPVLMRKFKLQLRYKDWSHSVDEITALDRKYQRIGVTLRSDEDVQGFRKISERFGALIRALEFNKQSFNLEALRTFQLFPALRELKIEQFQLKNPAAWYLSFNFPTVELNFLTELTLSMWTSWLVLKSFRCPNLQKFIISMDFDSEPRQPLLDFLSNTRNLKTLKIDEGSFEAIFSSDESSRLPFQLKSLDVFSRKVVTPAMVKNFKKFLESQQFSLQNVSFKVESKKITAGILRKLKAVHTLNVNCNALPASEDFYKKSATVESLKILITEKIPHEGLLGILPNIEALKINQSLSNFLHFLSRHNTQLKAIETVSFNLTPEQAEQLQLKSLKYLNVEYVGQDSNPLMKFLEKHTSIETFCLRYAYETKIFDTLSKMPNLKHLKFGGETDDMKKLFELSYEKCKNIETLEIIFEKIRGRPAMLFKFPEDEDQLLVKCPHVAKYEKTPESEFGYRISVCHTSEFEHKPLMADYCSDPPPH